MDALFFKVLNISWSAGWLVTAVILLRLVLKKAPRWTICCLWGLVALRLLCPVSFESSLSLIPKTTPLESLLSGIPEAVSVPEEAYAAAANAKPGDIVYAYSAPAETMQEESETEIYLAAPTENGSGTKLIGPVEPFRWITMGIIIWVVGIGAMLLNALWSYYRIRRKVAPSIDLGNHVLICDYIDTPFILGIFRPKIYLPSALAPDHAAHVLAHEQAHLHRRDHWWKPLGYILLSVYWFHPLLWLGYILLCRDIELACDEKVIRDMESAEKKAYAEALVECSIPRSMIAICPLAFGEVGVKQRVKSVLHYKKPGFWILTIALILCTILAVCFLTDPHGSITSRLPVPDRGEIDQIYLSDSKGSVSMTAQWELDAVWTFLDSLSCSPKPYKEKSIYDLNTLDYARFHTVKFIRNSEEAGLLYFYLPESAVCPVTDDPMLQFYPIQNKKAVEDFFDLWISPVTDREVMVQPFATGEDPFLWASEISPEAIREATRHTYSGRMFVTSRMSGPRFEILIEHLNSLPKDAFGPMQEFSGPFATIETKEPNVGAVLQDAANGLTAAVRYYQSGERDVLQLLMVPELKNSDYLIVPEPHAKLWEIHDEELLSYMKELYEKESLVHVRYASWLNWKEDTLSLSCEDAAIEILPCDEWIYETVSPSGESPSFGFRARPQAIEEGWLYFSFWPDRYDPIEENRYYDTWPSSASEFDDGVTSYRSTRVNRFSNDPWRNVWSYQKQCTDIGDFAIISTFSNKDFKEYLEEITAVRYMCHFSGGNPVPVSTSSSAKTGQ